MKRFVLIAAVTLCTSPMPVFADAVAGRAFVRHNCSECHDIGEPGEPGSVQSGPRFRVVAQTLSEMRLRDFLASPHKRMPRVGLTPQETNDVVAYFKGLNSKP